MAERCFQSLLTRVGEREGFLIADATPDAIWLRQATVIPSELKLCVKLKKEYHYFDDGPRELQLKVTGEVWTDRGWQPYRHLSYRDERRVVLQKDKPGEDKPEVFDIPDEEIERAVARVLEIGRRLFTHHSAVSP